MKMFENSRTMAKAGELRAYNSESEDDAKRRLEAAGWVFSGVDYEFDNGVFKLATGKDEVAEGAGDDSGE